MPDNSTGEGALVRTLRLTQRHLALVVVAALVGALLGLTFGLTRPTTYKAETRLVVGTFDAPADAVPGYVLAAQTVAQDYARLARTPQVTDPLSERLGTSPSEVGSKISVVAIPGSAILRVVATSGDEAEAREMAEGMSQVIQDTVTALNAPVNGEQLLAEYTSAATEVALANARVIAAQNAPPGSATAADLNAANVALAAAELKASALEAQYQASQRGSSTSGQVRALGGAIVEESSKAMPTLIATAVGLLVGLGAGLLLALGRDRAGRHQLAVVETHPAAASDSEEDGADDEHADEADGEAS